MIRCPPRFTRPYPRFPYTTLFRSLHYVDPYPHVDAVIPLMAEGLLTPYLDIPFQHASPSVLKRMKRPANEAKVLERLKNWRTIAPDIRSEEHTSELQSLMRISYAVFCLKKNKYTLHTNYQLNSTQ